ncbi:tyrosine-type recombinase/integrase [Streptomyces morookaense]|uniref:tyrosine-type recombinase/integrase n=1 Tax=Streptomyces morookaense TaxID=1970 RepID=UPI00340C592D
MSTARLARGMGSFFKNCDCVRQARCSHAYSVRFRDATGKQREETGYPTQQDAIERLNRAYEEKRSTPPEKAEIKREIGRQRFGKYAGEWLLRQRHYAPGSVRTVKTSLNNHILPVLASRRMDTFTSRAVEDFVQAMEETEVGPAAQQNAFDTLKKVLRDAQRRAGFTDDPFEGVVPPKYAPKRAVIPTFDEIQALKEVGDRQVSLIIDLMSGCGMRNGEAYAANVHRMVADDVYRITEQIDGVRRERAPLKHRELGEFRETPMPQKVRESILLYQEDFGTDPDGYLLRAQRSPYWGHSTLEYRWAQARKRAGITRKLPPYSMRHYFASNCLSRGIPITDVAEWMGHSSIQLTFKIYRHLMPASIGRAARILNEGL